MKQVFIFISFLIVSTGALAQETYKVSGVITNDLNEPLSSINVAVKGTSIGTQSDFDGNYSLNLSKGNYILVFSGYEQVIEEVVAIDNNVILNLQIFESTELLDEVLVNAIRVKEGSPMTYSNLSKEELATRNLGQDIPILLNYLPSVVTTTDAGAGVGYTGIRVRGSDATRVNVTINGIPYNDSESHGTFWVNLGDFASSIESLQLQRGVGTSTNGAGAFGASLNILTDVVSDKANAEIATSIGSFNTFKNTIKFSSGKLNDHFELAGRLSRITSDGYIDRAESELKSYFLQGSYVGDNTLIKAIAFGGFERTYQSWFGIDAATLETDRTFNPAGLYTDDNGNTRFYDNEVDNYNQDHYQLHWNQRFNNNWSSNIAVHYTYGRGYFEQYKEDEDFSTYGFTPISIGGETIETTDVIRRRWLDNDFYGTTFSLNYNNPDTDLVFGGSYNVYHGDHYGEVIWAQFASDSAIRDRYYDNSAKKTEFNVYTKGTFKLDENWSLYADLQLRKIDYSTNGGLNSDLLNFAVNDDFTFFNPKIGANYQLDIQNSFYASYARANREPNRTDYENGEPESETLNDFELGWRHNSTKSTINANMYYMAYDNQLVLTGALDDVGAPLRANSGNSYRLGLEVDAQFNVSEKFSILPNVGISTNKNIDFTRTLNGELVKLGSTDISYSPDLIIGNMIQYKPLDNLQLAFLSKYVGDQFMSNFDVEASKLDSYFVNDLNITYEIKPKSIFKSIVLSGLVNNMFNTEYVSNGYYFTFDAPNEPNPGVTTFDGAGYYPQAGTNFLLGATLKF